MAGCCVFLLRPSSLGYRALTCDDNDLDGPSPAAAAVTVVVGKERREFLVDPSILSKDPFRLLLGMTSATTRSNGGQVVEKKRKRKRSEAIFVDVDSILFEHMLWLIQNDDGINPSFSLLQRNLRDIVEFYTHDF